jgi:hypothetical protein
MSMILTVRFAVGAALLFQQPTRPAVTALVGDTLIDGTGRLL